MNIALLIPITSSGRQWNNLYDSYLINLTLTTFWLTKNDCYNYTFYLGFDEDDHLFNNSNNIELLEKIFDELNLKLNITIYKNVKKGHLTILWNILYQKAYDDNNDYYYQCGDDIQFKTKDWVKDSVEILIKNNNFGVSGPNNIDTSNILLTLTQAMVSRTHMELFGYLYPPSIINWYCDNWISEVYQPKYFFKLNEHFAPNVGGAERYLIERDKSAYLNELIIGQEKVNNYIANNFN